MAQRVPRSLLALSSTVVAAIYAAGYVRTQAADNELSAAEAATPAAAVAAVPPAATSQAVPSTPVPTVPLPLVSPTTAIASGLRDGTYQGQGTSRRGNVYVQVTVQNGRITSVEIARSTTEYPVARISALPGQVVARQSANVDVVSGATLSTSAFRQAVAQAVAQAQ